MVGTDSAEAAEQARFAVELYAIGALNLLASLAFLVRRSGWGWWLVLGMQVGVFVGALIEGVLTDLGWFFFSSLPLLTLFLLLAFRLAEAMLKPPVEHNLTPSLTPEPGTPWHSLAHALVLAIKRPAGRDRRAPAGRARRTVDDRFFRIQITDWR
jgi:hypothetical protein